MHPTLYFLCLQQKERQLFMVGGLSVSRWGSVADGGRTEMHYLSSLQNTNKQSDIVIHLFLPSPSHIMLMA